MGKPTLNCLGYILVVFHTLQDSTSIALKGYVFCIFVHLGSHHIASNWFEILRTSPNDCLLSIKQSLSKLSCIAEGLLELTSGCNILPLSFVLLNFWKFQILAKSLETLHKWPKQSSLMKKLTLNCPGYILVVLQTLQDLTFIASRAISLVSFFI